MKGLLLIAVAAVALQESASWRLVYQVYEKGSVRFTRSVAENGKDRRDELLPPPDGIPKVYSTREKGISEIWVADADGKNKKRLTRSKAYEYQARWTADRRRIVFVSGRTGDWQLWIMDSDGGNQTQLTRHPAGARDPEVSPAGDVVAYREFLSDTPPGICTLRISDLAGKESKGLIEKADFRGFAWSLKGDRLACGLRNEVRFLEIPSGKLVRKFDLKDIHKELTNHSAKGMVWRSDSGAVACRFTVRDKPAEGGVKSFGDDQVFILPVKGSPVIIEAGGEAWPVRWMR
jgi:WD40 repeat protein